MAGRLKSRPKTRSTETNYARLLRKIADHVGTLVESFRPGDPAAIPTIRAILEQYSVALTDWAKATAAKMLTDVNAQDERSWRANSNQMSIALRREIQSAPTGATLQQLLAEQVVLIKSIPLEAAERVHKLTLAGLQDSTRASEIAKEILRTNEVSRSRATLIARTEVARTASVLTQARARHVGATHYVWRTAEDRDVRQSHKEMDGKIFAWDDTPRLSDGTVTHPGRIWNCRCWPEVIIPERSK
jgi:SPP1 gp7 family putative phage head morphogenesis protein